MNTTIGILGNDFNLSTSFVEKIILKTNAKKDQDHIKMNIIINNKLFEKNEKDLKDIITNLENSKIDYLILNFNNQNIYNFIKNNTYIQVLNNKFDLNNNLLIDKIIELSGKETL